MPPETDRIPVYLTPAQLDWLTKHLSSIQLLLGAPDYHQVSELAEGSLTALRVAAPAG